MEIAGNFRQNETTSVSKPISSLEEFNQKYSVDVVEGIILVTDRINNCVLKKYTTKKEEDQFSDWEAPHFHNGIFYFVLSSHRYTRAKYVYSFDPNKQSINSMLGPLRNPNFIENLLVEFGSGFTTPGEQIVETGMRNGEGIIKIYDLHRSQGQREIRKIFVKDGAGYGWDGGIDEEKKEITAFDHVTGTDYKFPIFDKV